MRSFSVERVGLALWLIYQKRSNEALLPLAKHPHVREAG